RLEATVGASELAGWQVDSAGITVTFPAAGPDSFRVRATRRGGSFELAGTTTREGWRGEYSASGLPLEAWPDGRRSGLRGPQGRAGDTVGTAGASADGRPKVWRLGVDRAAAKSTRLAWLAGPPLALSGDPKGVSFDRVKAADGPSSLEVSGRWAGPGGFYDWAAHGRSLQLGRLGLPADWRLAGAADVDLQVHGLSGEPRWDLDGRLSEPGWQG